METVPLTVLASGTRVRCASVDMNGLHGRDPHPTETDVGFEGRVVGNHVEYLDHDGCLLETADDVPAGTVVNENDLVIYTVEGPGGRQLKLASYEIELCNPQAI